jgi:hypothetical protein
MEAATHMTDYPIVSLRLFATDIGFHRRLIQTGSALTLEVIEQLPLIIEERGELKVMLFSLLHHAVNESKPNEGDAILSLLLPMTNNQDILMIQARMQQTTPIDLASIEWVNSTCRALEVVERLIPQRVTLKQARNMLSKHKNSVELAVRELGRDMWGAMWR